MQVLKCVNLCVCVCVCVTRRLVNDSYVHTREHAYYTAHTMPPQHADADVHGRHAHTQMVTCMDT